MPIKCIMRRTVALLAAALVVMSVTPLAAQTNPVVKEFKPIKVSQLIGMKVENRDGEEFGRLRDLALDLRTGRIKYAIVASGGFLGVQARLRAVPPHLLSAATAKRNTLALNLAMASWIKAPTFRLSELPALARADRGEAINRFYQHAMAQSADGFVADSSVSSNPPLAQTGRDAAEHSTPPRELKLTGDLIGSMLRGRSQERLGGILDLLVALDEQTPVFAILSTGKLFKDEERRYAIPLRRLNAGATGKWTLNADPEALRRAADFKGHLSSDDESSDSLELFRYYDSQQK
jgi:PRC-barrel domain